MQKFNFTHMPWQIRPPDYAPDFSFNRLVGIQTMSMPIEMLITSEDDSYIYRAYDRVRRLGKKKPRGKKNKIALAIVKEQE